MTDGPTTQALIPPQHIVDVALEIAGWSPCQSKRGVVLFRDQDIVSHGYNYKPRGFDCDGSDACKATCRVEAIHAEQQALLAASLRASGADLLHVKAANGQLVPSGGPSCVQCSKLALVAGIAGVWLYHDSGWRRYEAAEFHALSLRAAADALRSLPPPAVIGRWRTYGTPRCPRTFPEIPMVACCDHHSDGGCDCWDCVEIRTERERDYLKTELAEVKQDRDTDEEEMDALADKLAQSGRRPRWPA